MRVLSDATLALIDEVNNLARERAWPWSKAPRIEKITSGLERIGASGEWPAIPRILSLVLDSRRDIAEAAAKAVKQLRVGVRIQNLGVFDRSFRELSPYMHPEYMLWRSMSARQLKRVASLENGAAALQFAMCHPAGYVREEAIRLSAACADGAEIPILLLRCNDWVKPVQELARSALRARLRAENLPDLIVALPMLEEMRKWGRLGEQLFLDEIDDLLGGAEGTRHLLRCRDAPDRFTRRAAFRRLVESSHADPQEVFDSALADDDPAIRSWAGRRLCDSEEEVFLRSSEKLLSNRLGAIRVRAAERLLTLERTFPWKTLLFDTHSGVRTVAYQGALNEGVAPDDEYRQDVPTCAGARLGVTLIGLGETGGRDDIELVRPYLSHNAPRVRRSALYALAKLKAEDLVKLCLSALSDPSPSVAHTARKLLIAGPSYVSPASVWEAFTRTNTTWGKKDALTVLSNLDHWERLPYLLQAFAASDPDVKERASLCLTHWVARLNRVFTSPSSEIESASRRYLQAPAFSAAFRQELTKILDSRTDIRP